MLYNTSHPTFDSVCCTGLFWSILIRFCQLWSVSPGQQSRVTRRTLSPLWIIIRGWSPLPSLPHNLECWVQAGIQDCESHIMCYGSQGTRCNVTTQSPDLSNAEKLKHARYSPFRGNMCFFRYIHCHSTDQYWRPGGNDSGRLPDFPCGLYPP